MIPDWLAVRLSAWQLDQDLARGVPPSHSPRHARRAELLTRSTTRCTLARSLRRVADGVTQPTRGITSVAEPHRPSVGPWAEALNGLAEALCGPGPMSACCVARIRLLISDGAGPLYTPEAERDLPEMIWWIADAMDAGSDAGLRSGQAVGRPGGW